MARLPPAAKLPLALRKNIRDKWEEKKAEFEKKISATLGTAWTIDINPLAIFPYGTSSYATENLGTLISGYVSGAAFQLEGFVSQYGADGLADLNKAASEHVLTMDVDESGTISYCGCAIQGGKLAILFNEKNLGSNDSDAVSPPNLLKALNEVPPAEGAAPELSFIAKTSVRKSYDPKVGAVQAKIGELLARTDITLTPNFEALYTALLAESKKPGNKLYRKWEDQVGPFVLSYFDSVRNHLEYNKFDKDEMLQEGFNEAVESGAIEFRLVDKLAYANYCEVVVEDGKLFVQTTLEKYGSNINDAAQKLVDQL